MTVRMNINEKKITKLHDDPVAQLGTDFENEILMLIRG